MPGSVRLVSDERPGVMHELRLLSTWGERLRGLLGTGPDAEPAMLVRCGSVHTFGMTYALDVALVGELGEVLLGCRVPTNARHMSNLVGADHGQG